MKYLKYFLIAFLVIVLDQISKLLVHHYMYLGEEIVVFNDWFRLHYLLNPGMAFGKKLDIEYGKLALTTFRLIASVGIGYLIVYLVKNKNHPVMVACIALILGGAIGNLLDSIFYGVFIEGNAIKDAPTPWFHGQVIDMLYFPFWSGYLPDWLPIFGGRYWVFFSYVFNIADSAIFVGVVTILIFQNKFNQYHEAHKANAESVKAKDLEDPIKKDPALNDESEKPSA
jgi:signal peptidase II